MGCTYYKNGITRCAFESQPLFRQRWIIGMICVLRSFALHFLTSNGQKCVANISWLSLWDYV